MRRRRRSTAFAAYGVHVEIKASDYSLLEQTLARVMPPRWHETDGSGADVRFVIRRGQDGLCDLNRDDTPIARGAEEEIALSILDSAIRSELSVRAVGFVFVHAGVVRIGEEALLLPGDSFSGKSTLVAALVRHGATYMSDEFALLTADGRVHPYPRDISLRPPGQHACLPHNTRPSDIGAVAIDDDAAVRFIFTTRYRPDGRWQPVERLSGEGALALMAHAAAARERPAEVLATVRAAAEGSIVLDGDRGDAQETARLMLAHVRERQASPASRA